VHDTPLITIAVPVYNGENYLQHCLRSLLDQEYKTFEIIVVDDGSKDWVAVENIIKSFSDERIRLFRQENGGVASALNYVIREMRGQYFAWLSHDDIFNKDKLRVQADFILQNFQADEILYSGYQIIDENGFIKGVADFSSLLNDCERLGGLERGLINGCSILINKKIIDEVGFFDERLRYTQDYDYWLRCMQAGKSFRYIPLSLIKTRIHSAQDSNRHRKAAHLEAENLWLRILDFWITREGSFLDRNIKQMLEFRVFLSSAGFSLAEQKLSQLLVSYVERFKVSIIIPVSNKSYLLEIALKSIEGQLHKNFEVIVVNDAPGTDSELKAIIEKFSFPIKCIENLENLGAGQSRNIGIGNATGDYVCFLDSDDFFLPDKLSEQLAAMISADAEISHSSYFARSSHDGSHAFRDTSRHSGEDQDRFIATYGCSIATPTVMVTRELLLKNPTPFPNSHSPGEDISAWIVLFKSSTRPLLHLSTPLTVVRTHINSAANDPNAQRESLLLINRTLDELGIERLPSQLSIHSFPNRLIPKMFVFPLKIVFWLFSYLPFSVRNVLKKNRFITFVYERFQKRFNS
jgi:glycosyltransferase involved in cell wall biosynthesis